MKFRKISATTLRLHISEFLKSLAACEASCLEVFFENFLGNHFACYLEVCISKLLWRSDISILAKKTNI